MLKKLTLGLVASTFLAGLSVGAQAQVQMPGWFGAIDGMYVLDTAGRGSSEFTDAGFGRRLPGDGWGLNGLLGYRFANPWDVAITTNYMDLSRGKSDAGGGPPYAARVTDMNMWGAGLVVGYTMAGAGYNFRPFAGVTYQHWHQDFRDFIGTIYQTKMNAWGVGPKVGFDVAVNLSGPVSLLAGAEGAVLFGHIKDSKNGSWLGDPAVNGSNGRTFFTVGGKLALDWEIAPLVHLAAGYKAEWLDGVSYTHFDTNDGGPGGQSGGRAHMLVHGPFARLAYNVGVSRAPAAPVAQPPAVVRPNYIVFFDFDRSNLTPTALATIKQAADAAKAGKSARVNVTGHADKSGGDQYNMALSLRRANAVKDQLVKEGVPAASIVVVGRGESQPLVPTADGVKEPQNRRVEIVLN